MQLFTPGQKKQLNRYNLDLSALPVTHLFLSISPCQVGFLLHMDLLQHQNPKARGGSDKKSQEGTIGLGTLTDRAAEECWKNSKQWRAREEFAKEGRVTLYEFARAALTECLLQVEWLKKKTQKLIAL